MKATARLQTWHVASAIWLVVLLLGPISYLAQARLYGQSPGSLQDMLFSPSAIWLLCALVLPAFLLVSRRWPLTSSHLARQILVHLLCATLLWSLALILYQGWLALLLNPEFAAGMAGLPGPVLVQRVTTHALGMALTTLPLAFALYACVAGVDHATRYFAQVRDRELQMSRLSEQLTGARYAALQAQVNPHFLFNTLNTIAVRARDGDGLGTARMVEQLSELMRRTLGRQRAQEVTLEEEIELVQEYLAIEQARFPDRLHPHFDIDETTRHAAVPGFAIQHLAENAIRHGISKRPGSGQLSIKSRRDGDQLVVTVTDDGAGLPLEVESARGQGLSNTRERLRMLYGAAATLELSTTAGATVATLRVPYRELSREIDHAGS